MTHVPSLYSVRAYAYGCAHDGDEPFVTSSLERALLVLADELDDYGDYLAEGAHSLDVEELDEHSSALVEIDALKRSAESHADRMADRPHSHGALEHLESVLDYSNGRGAVLGSVVLEIDEPGSFARGRTFVLESVSLEELYGVSTLEELEELEHYGGAELAETLREELEEL